MILTESQLRVRDTGIGGSELAAILGKSSFAGPLEVFHTKTHSPLAKSFDMSHYQQFGHITEGAIARYLAKYDHVKMISGVDYAKSYYKIPRAIHLVDGTYRNIVYPRLLVTPDFISQTYLSKSRCLREIKSVGPWSGAHTFSGPDSKKEKFPEGYKIQTNMQMYSLNIKCGKLNVFVSDNKIIPELVEPLWEAWSAGGLSQYEVDLWADEYVESYGDVREYDIPYDEALAKEHGRFTMKWWADYVETGVSNPEWKPTHVWVAQQKRQLVEEPALWGSGF